MRLSSAMSLKVSPVASCPEGSIFCLYSSARHCPRALKFSKASPSGSMRLWHDAHMASARWTAIVSRRVGTRSASLDFASSKAGISGGGGENVFQYPLAPFDGRRASGIGRDHKDTAHGENPAARVAGRQRNLAQLRALDVADLVGAGQRLVEEGVVAGEEFVDAAVFAEHVF